MRLKFLLFYFVLMLALFGIISTPKAYAEPATGILFSLVPPNPTPNENTTITLKSYENNLDILPISWSVNGKVISSGIGRKSFSINAPTTGETNVVVTVSLPENDVDTTITIKPSVMVLLWQATDSCVPPFYKGKALPTPNSEIRIVAMPEAKNVQAQNMTYNWKKDYTNNVDGSGYGKNSFTYVNDYLQDSNNVSVTASTVDQKSSFSSSIDVGTTKAKILFYKISNDLGTIWGSSLTDPHKMQGPEILEATPYFMSPKEIQHPSLIWSWFINDERINLTGLRKNLMPLQITTGAHGTSVLRLNVENRDSLFQATTKEINIEF